MQRVRLFDPQECRTLICRNFSDNISGANCTSVHEETVANNQAVKEIDLGIEPLKFWFSNKEHSPHLLDFAMCYLDVTSLMQSTELASGSIASELQCHNLALQVMVASSDRD